MLGKSGDEKIQGKLCIETPHDCSDLDFITADIVLQLAVMLMAMCILHDKAGVYNKKSLFTSGNCFVCSIVFSLQCS